MVRSRLTIFIMGVILVVKGVSAQVKEIAFYVSPNGNDAWSGKLPSPNKTKTDGPFATLHRAVEAVRQLKRQQGGKLKQPVTIYLRQGFHFLREPIVLTPEDSG
ncbi:MAG: right-handed parallel beta-helix repeat-containing protein, partial [Armatimonadetes bacterium]|nr:right-handed parallel beta-helix repeat-containing protein [Armatimonadota bacterium]